MLNNYIKNKNELCEFYYCFNSIFDYFFYF